MLILSTPEGAMSSTLKTFAPYLLLIVAVFVAYSNVYDNSFLLDDEFLLIKNSFLHGWSNIGLIFTSSSTQGAGGVDMFYRPMQTLLYLIVYQMCGLSPPAFHLLNVSLHAANACLMFMLGQRLGFNPVAVLLASLLWALHPLHVEAVTYMSATADTLYAFFCLLGMVVLLPDFTRRRIIAACALFALALLSKETAIIFPLLATSCLFLVSQNRRDWRVYIKLSPLWLVACVYIALHFTVMNFDGLDFYKHENIYSENILYRFYTFLATLPNYFGLILWPADLHMEYAFPVYVVFFCAPVIVGATMFVLALGQIIRTALGGKGLALSFGLLWFASAYLPYTGVFLPVNSLFLEHWMYLPLCGLLLGVMAELLEALHKLPIRQTRNYGITILACLVIMLGAGTYEQNAVWKNPIVFYNNILKYNDHSARVHNNIAMAYSDMGEDDLAIEHYLKAIKIDDSYAQTHYNLALLLLKQRDFQKNLPEAEAQLERALAINPKFFQAEDQLRKIHEYLGA